MPGGDGTGPLGQGPRTGRGRFSAGGRGRMGGPSAAGPGGFCKCPSCGYEMTHTRALPCNKTKCPKCGTLMVRA
jgi:uncharacterized protein